MTLAELQTLLRERLDPEATVHDMRDDGGEGVVFWSRPIPWDGYEAGREYVVHRWASRDTSHEAIPAMFWGGGYYSGRQAALDGFLARP